MEKKTQAKAKVEIVMTGVVASSKADKTVSVEVQRIFQHPVYKKIVRKNKKVLAHDGKNQCRPGDVVRIRLVRPISRRKHWLIQDILSKAPEKIVTVDEAEVQK